MPPMIVILNIRTCLKKNNFKKINGIIIVGLEEGYIFSLAKKKKL